MAIFRYQHGEKPLEGFTIKYGLGRGGFGEVYYAVSDSGREVALKAVQNYEDIELRGIKQCMNLKHQQLVSIFDIKHSADGLPFVVMEFVDGPSLREIMDSHPEGLGSAKAAFFLQQMAKGIGYLHDCGVVHRDLKPHNVFYENGIVKIGDYSLSKAITTSHRSGHTMTVGTIHYMAPEIAHGKYNHTVDIYALGVMLYEMLTGNPPFLGETMGEVLMKHVNGDVDVSGLDEPFARVIKRAMAKDPDDRYQSTQEMLDELMGYAELQNSVASLGPESLTMIAEKAVRKAKQTAPDVDPLPSQEAAPGAARADQPTTPFNSPGPKIKIRPASSETLKRVVFRIVLLCLAFLGFGVMTNDDEGFVFFMWMAIVVSSIYALYTARRHHRQQVWRAKHRPTVDVATKNTAPQVTQRMRLPFLWTVFKVSGVLCLVLLIGGLTTSPRHFDRGVRNMLEVIAPVTVFVFGISSLSLLFLSLFRSPRRHLREAKAEPIMYAAKVDAARSAQPAASGSPPQPKPVTQPQPVPPPLGMGPHPNASPYSRLVSLCMSLPLFLGIPLAGLQRIYVGRVKTGILWLLTFGLFGIGQLYDVIMIAVGHFKDAEGRRVLSFTREKLDQFVRQPVNQYSAVVKQNWSDSRVGFRIGNVLLNLIGGILLIIALAAGALRAIDLPEAAAQGVFGRELQSGIMEEFGIRDWDALASLLLAVIATASASLAAVALIFARRESTWKHMVRVVFSAMFFGLSLISLGSISRMGTRWQYVATLVNDGLIGTAMEELLPSISVGLFFGSVFFVLGMFLLAWPADRGLKQLEAGQTHEKRVEAVEDRVSV